MLTFSLLPFEAEVFLSHPPFPPLVTSCVSENPYPGQRLPSRHGRSVRPPMAVELISPPPPLFCLWAPLTVDMLFIVDSLAN